MKILLISPERERKKEEAFLFRIGFLNLPYVAAVTPSDVEVRIVDEAFEKINFEEKPDLVGLTAQTPAAPRAYQIADQFRKREVPVVMGGVHASMLPDEALRHVDAVVIGEAEEIWPQLIEEFKRGHLKRVYQADGFINPSLLPFPKRELLNPRFYFPLKLLETTRGCPHHCDFCGVSKFFGFKYRNRPIAEIDKELATLFSKGSVMNPFPKKILSLFNRDLPYFLKKRLLYIIDSNIAGDKRFALDLVSLLKEYDLLWYGHAPVSIAFDQKLLEGFSQSGCIAINIGFESFSLKNLKAMGKGFNQPSHYAEAVQRIHDYGIGIMGTFIVGLDDDDQGVFQRIIDFCIDSKLDWALTFIMAPYPGTESYLRLEREGRIFCRDWEKYDSLNVVYQPLLMSVEDLEKGMRRIWKEVFSLSSIYKRILKRPWIHPLFYLTMNYQFHHLTKKF
ncbi:MAG: B12-binding domain-containing radical SAM protein, partial [Deltaproteobacteria bacterium]|nr:B12-binding domain-containing radical SAM protein [Deltaproteobacteria bacterium]